MAAAGLFQLAIRQKQSPIRLPITPLSHRPPKRLTINDSTCSSVSTSKPVVKPQSQQTWKATRKTPSHSIQDQTPIRLILTYLPTRQLRLVPNAAIPDPGINKIKTPNRPLLMGTTKNFPRSQQAVNRLRVNLKYARHPATRPRWPRLFSTRIELIYALI